MDSRGGVWIAWRELVDRDRESAATIGGFLSTSPRSRRADTNHDAWRWGLWIGSTAIARTGGYPLRILPSNLIYPVRNVPSTEICHWLKVSW
jgi:hypothetical protein